MYFTNLVIKEHYFQNLYTMIKPWILFCLGFFFFLVFFFRATPTAYGSSRLGVELELQLLAYITATATWDLSRVCDLHCNSQQRWTLNPLSNARDRTYFLMDTSWICYHCATMGTAILGSFKKSLWAEINGWLPNSQEPNYPNPQD